MENVRNLPQELVEEILTRLPCKSLIRFKCVCKHWNALFHKDTKFLSRHVSHYLKNQNSAANDVLFRFPFATKDCTVAFKLLSMSATNPGMEIPVPTFKQFRICGHSNGILCLSALSTDDAQVLLYNPLTREFRQLPPYTIDHSSRVAVGMGYDSFTNDFKVISIWERPTATSYYATEQYTLSTDSWTAMPNTNAHQPFSFDSESFALCFNRTFYWWAWHRNDYSTVVVALNMDDGVFQIVPKPPAVCIGSIPHTRSLTVWNDSISLVCCSGYHSIFNVEIWVMGGFGSWTLMRTIKYMTKEPKKPLVFWNGNELLMEMVFSGKIKSYNVDTEQVKDLPIKFTGRSAIFFEAVNYVASLVPLRGETYLDGEIYNAGSEGGSSVV